MARGRNGRKERQHRNGKGMDITSISRPLTPETAPTDLLFQLWFAKLYSRSDLKKTGLYSSIGFFSKPASIDRLRPGKPRSYLGAGAHEPDLHGHALFDHRNSVWIFPSARTKGETPRSAGVARQDYLRPAAVKAGVMSEGYNGRFGWHQQRCLTQSRSRLLPSWGQLG